VNGDFVDNLLRELAWQAAADTVATFERWLLMELELSEP